MKFLNLRTAIGIFIIFIISIVSPASNVHANENDNFLITVETDKDEYDLGETVEYEIRVKNISLNEASNLLIIDELPSSVEIVSTDGERNENKIRWEKEELLPQEEVILHLSLKLNEVTVAPPVGDNSDGDEDTTPPTEDGDEDTTPPTEDGNDSNDVLSPPTTGGNPGEDNQMTSPDSDSNSNPETGYKNLTMLIIGIILIGLGCLMYKIKVKNTGKFLLLLLLCSVGLGKEVNAESVNASQQYTHSVKVDGENIESNIILSANLLENEPIEPTLIDVSLTFFSEEYSPLSNDSVYVKIGEDDSYSCETDEKGFIKLKVPLGSSVSLTHPSIESLMTINANGDVSIENKKGETIIGFIERTEAGFVSYRENITNFKTDNMGNIEELDLESGKFIYNGILELKKDEIIVIPAFGDYVSGIAIKIVESKVENSKTLATITQPELDEVYKSIDIKLQPSMENAQIKLEDGVELSEAIAYSGQNFSAHIKKFKVDGIEIEGLVAGSIEHDLRINIDFDWLDTDIKEIKYELDAVSSGEFEISSDDIFNKTIEKTLLTFMIPTPIAGISVNVPIEFNSELKGNLSSTWNIESKVDFGFQYTSSNGLKTFPESSNKIFNEDISFTATHASGEAKAGLTISALLAALSMDIAGIGIGAGAEVHAIAGANLEDDTVCFSWDAGAYGLIGLKSPIIPEIENFEYSHYMKMLEGEVGACGEEPDPVLVIEVLPKNITMIPGESVHLMLMLGSEEITFSPDLTYQSDDSSKLAVTHDGVVTAKELGIGEIINIRATYKKNGQETTVDIPISIQSPTIKGILKGQIVDATSENPINEANIKIYDESGDYLNRYYTDSSGNYRLLLEPGTYLVVVEKPGYLKESGKVKVMAANTTVYEPMLHLVNENESGDGTIRGKITDSIDNSPLSQVQLDIYKGFNTTTGEIVQVVETNELGEYEAILPAGNYTAIIKKAGFVSSTIGILAIGNQIRVHPTISLSPEGLELDDIRIVLNWGANPLDLDAHLIGTIDDTLDDYFHVYYGNSNYNSNTQSAFLDRDDIFSYGPETITLTNLNSEGLYVYSIHDFTNQGNGQNLELASSEAMVRVYSGDSLLATFSVPKTEIGNTWKVFEIKDGQIVPLNEMTTINNNSLYESFLPNRLSNTLLIEPLSQEQLMKDKEYKNHLDVNEAN